MNLSQSDLSLLQQIGQLLLTQDNACTSQPMFCVQEKKRDVGYDSDFSENACWHDGANDETIYDDDKDFKKPEGDQWDEFGYRDRWETVMVAFTQSGCEQYLRLNGHNHRGQTRIYVESFHRCPEMIAIREILMRLATPAASPDAPHPEALASDRSDAPSHSHDPHSSSPVAPTHQLAQTA